MLDNSIVNETSQEANWNGQTDRRTDGQDHVLSQADALTKKHILTIFNEPLIKILNMKHCKMLTLL